jgi:hypothetical protein
MRDEPAPFCQKIRGDSSMAPCCYLSLRRRPSDSNVGWWIGLIFAVAWGFIAVGSADAVDRGELRFRRLLVGRSDQARLMAMRSLSADFQTRKQVLPVVAESLEKLLDDPRYKTSDRSEAPPLPDGIAAMIRFVGQAESDESIATLIKILDSPRPTWTMAATMALCEHRRVAAIEAITQLRNSEHFDNSYAFRFTVARGLVQMDHPDAWEALATLYDQVDGQLAHHLQEKFATVTAESFEDDNERFHRWRGLVGLGPRKEAENDAEAKKPDGIAADLAGAKLPQTMRLSPSKSAADYRRQRRLTPSRYYGIDIYAKRLIFILDRSGSMNEQVGSFTRIRQAKRELIAAISGLDERCEFSILVFDRNVRSWREELVPATVENKREAIQFVEHLSAGSSTNTYGALRCGLEFDDQLEALFILTDGEPTYGMLTDPSAILVDILKRNEWRHVSINTIAIAVDPLIEGFLRRLTEPSGGEFRSVK